MPQIYDISTPLQSNLAPWPGDVPFERRLTARLSEGASVNLSAITMSLHVGTHADAFYHYEADGVTIDELDLNAFIGDAIVVDVSGKDVVGADDLPNDLAARLLLKTDSWKDRTRFPRGFPVMTTELPSELAKRGVILVGVDVPSVDRWDSKNLPVHHALGAERIHILETLDLSAVPAGRYELVALPLRIVGGDGSPVRAILRR